MPQLDTSTWPPQLVWLAITFLVLYYIVSRIIIPRTGGVITERKSTVENDLAKAQQLKAETDAAAKAYEASLAEARQKAHAIAAENRDRVSAELDKERAKADAEAASRVADAEKSIATARAKAMTDVRSVASDIASDIVAALTGSKPSAADLEAAIAKASGK